MKSRRTFATGFTLAWARASPSPSQQYRVGVPQTAVAAGKHKKKTTDHSSYLVNPKPH